MKTILVKDLKSSISKSTLSILEQLTPLQTANLPESQEKIKELIIRRDAFYHLNSLVDFLSN